MSFEKQYRRLSRRFVNTEMILLVVMFVSSGYMLWGTLNFTSASAARFPRLTAGIVFVGALLLLVRDYLPDRIAALLTEESEVLETDEEIVDQEIDRPTAGETDESPEVTEISIVGRPIHDSLFTALITIGYGLLSFTIGIFLATPIFVLVYTRWFKLSWAMTIGLTVLGVVIGFVFISVLGVPIDRGEILFPHGIIALITVPVTGVS